MCAKLTKALYVTRDAAQNREWEHVEFMGGIGFRRGTSTPCIFWHEERGILAVIHGDVFTLLGDEVELDWVERENPGKIGKAQRETWAR